MGQIPNSREHVRAQWSRNSKKTWENGTKRFYYYWL